MLITPPGLRPTDGMSEDKAVTQTKPATHTGRGGSRSHVESLGYFWAEACNSCGIKMQEQGSTSFFCPACNVFLIGRCSHCRDLSAKYECAECGHAGP